MSIFRKLSHSIWHCQYHVVWVPKYRYRILTGAVEEACEAGIHAICGFAGCEVVELNVQPDHVHLINDGTCEAVDIAIIGTAEGADVDEIVPSVSISEEKALLGQSFLGERVLC